MAGPAPDTRWRPRALAGQDKDGGGSGAVMAAEAERASRPGTAAGSAHTTGNRDCPRHGLRVWCGSKGWSGVICGAHLKNLVPPSQ